MSHHPYLLLIALNAAALATSAAQQQRHVEVSATVIALPEADVIPKMLRGEFADDEALFAFAKARVLAGTARIEAAPKISTPSGQRAKFENIDLVTTPDSFKLTKNQPAKIAMVSYERRRCGTELEVDPTIGADGSVDINLAFTHHVARPTMTKFSTSLLEPAATTKSFVESPVFYYERTSQAMQLPSGGTRLAASMRPLEKRDGVQECHLMFASASIRPAVEASPMPSNQIALHFVAIEAPANIILKETLRRGNSSLAEDAALLGRMLDLVDSGAAMIANHSLVKTNDGHRVKTEIVRNNVSPTKYRLVEPDRVVPTAFELWPSGCTLEADPTFFYPEEGDPMIHFNIAPQIDGPMGWRTQRVALLESGTTGALVQPEFDLAKITTNCQVSCTGPGVILLGSMPSTSPGKQQLWFVRASVENLKLNKRVPTDSPTLENPILEVATTGIALPAAEAAALLLTRTSSDTELFEALTERVLNGGLQVAFQGSVTTTSNQRAKLESAKQIVGPTQFKFFGETGSLAAPSAFENQLHGFILEVDPAATVDGEHVSTRFAIDFSLAPPVFNPVVVDTKHPNAVVDARQDHPLKLTTAIHSSAGVPTLAGAIHPTGEAAHRAGVPEGTTILIFVQTNLRTP